jgi:hypothetical protein
LISDIPIDKLKCPFSILLSSLCLNINLTKLNTSFLLGGVFPRNINFGIEYEVMLTLSQINFPFTSEICVLLVLSLIFGSVQIQFSIFKVPLTLTPGISGRIT